jgi:outer membrane protein TolC
VNTGNPANTNMYMLMFGQAVPGRGKRALRSGLLEMDVELAAVAIAIATRDIIDRVEGVYADLFLVRRERKIHHANVRLLRQLADLSDVKYRTGRISQQDVLKAVVELSKSQAHLIVLDEREQLAAAELNTLLNRPVADDVGLLATPAETVVLPPVRELQRLALEQQPELKAAELEVRRAAAAHSLVRSDYRPDFSVTGGYMLMPGQRDAWMAKVGITWPKAPWAKPRVDAKAAEATASMAAAQARRDAVVSATREAVYTAHTRAQAASRRASLLRTTIVPQSEQTLEVSRVGYQTDQVDFLVLIDNQRVLLDTQVDYFRAVNDLERARAALKRAVGTDIIAWDAETRVGPSDTARGLR